MRLRSTLRRWAAAGIAVILAATIAQPAFADAASDRWVASFWPRAQAVGITRATYDMALGNFEPDPTILPRASSQAEFVRPVWDYLDSAVSDTRVSTGTAKVFEWSRTLDRIEEMYGVEREIVVAIWGIESSYGAILDNTTMVRPTITALATLAYQGGSRQSYGQTQLIAALKILQRGDVTLANMTGSWAGAMGHTQFIPTTFDAYAVDFDGDGRRNIWSSIPDALASTAAYLDRMGWTSGETWGYEVNLPASFDYRIADAGDTRTLAQWQALGVRRPSGSAFPRPSDPATLWVPAGAGGPAFLLLDNFRVIKRYNNANSYALAVGHLADRLAGFGSFRQEWPREQLPLTTAQRTELQMLLADLGLYNGAIDAEIGNGTKAAIRSWQRTAGLTPDGYASVPLLEQLRGD